MTRKLLFNLAMMVVFTCFSIDLIAQGNLNETFDGSIPGSWTVINNDGDTYYPKCPGDEIDGRVNYANFFGCADDYLVTPALLPTSGSNQLNFKAAAKYSFYSIDFQVLVSTTGTDPSDFTDVIQTWTGYNTATWAGGEQTLDLSSYNDTKIYVAFYTDGGDYSQWGIDDVNGLPIWAAGDDAGISAINSPDSATTVGSHDIQVTLKNFGSTTLSTVDIEWEMDGVQQTPYNWTGSLASGATELVTIGTDNFDGYHQIVVNTSNPNGNTDQVTDNDTLGKEILSIPSNYITQGFENNFPPQDWSMESISGNSWEHNSLEAYNGDYCAALMGTQDITVHSVSRLITPLLTINNNGFISFFARKYSLSYPDTIFIEYSPDGTSFTPIDTFTLTDSYQRYTCPLDAVGGNDYYLAIKGKTYNWGNIYLDDVLHPNVFLPENDAGIDSIVQPNGDISEGNKDIIVKLKNYGSNDLTSVDIEWAVNSTSQTTFNWSGVLTSGATEEVTIGSYNFSWATTEYNLEVNTSNPNSTSDPGNSNDSLSTEFFALHTDQLHESFEDPGFPPTDWDTIVSSSWHWHKTELSSYHQDSSAYYYNMSAFSEEKIVTPKLDINSGDKIVFYAYTSWPENNPSMKLMYSNDKVTWNDVSGSDFTLVGNWTRYEVDLSALAGNDYFIAFAASCTNQAAVYIDYITGPLKFTVAPTYTVTFNVIDETTTNPIENAKININNDSIYTDNTGVASIDLESGNYNYTVSADGYFDSVGSVSVVDSPVTVDIALEQVPTYTITFNVTDASTSNPIQGAEVAINSAVITTDASGVATIDLEDGSYPYTVSATGYEDSVGSVDVAGGPVTEDVQLTPIPPPTYTVTFNVTEASTSNPIQGAEVAINSAVITTDASGVATLDLEDGSYPYTVSATGYEDSVGSVDVAGGPVTEDVQLTPVAPPTYTVTFNVTDASTSNPIQGAEVAINSAVITTDASGVATLDLEDGSYPYTVSATGYEDSVGSVDVAGGPVTEDVQLTPVAPPTYTVTFNVMDASTSNPIQGAEITINSNMITTDASGVATIELEDGNYPYTVTASGYQDGSGNVDVVGNNVTEDVQMSPVPPPMFTVTFSVLDFEDSTPIAGAEIEVGLHNLVTDNNGIVSFDTINGTYNYNVTATDYKDTNGTITIDGADISEMVYMIQPEAVEDIEVIHIDLYPNPAKNMIHINSAIIIEKIQIVSIAGIVVDEKDVNAHECSYSQSLESGMYFIKLFIDDRILVRKLHIM